MPAARPSALRYELRFAEEVSRVPAAAFAASSLAYDAVSRRFLLGDAAGRRIVVVGEQSDSAIDLVRAASAGFHDVTALEIDVKRGDLWVASTAPDGATGAIHRIQLVSGRPLAMVEMPQDLASVRLVDLTIAGDGTLLVLDAAHPRVIRLRAGTNTPEELMPLEVAAPESIAVAGDGRTAFVAHRDGIVRLDLAQRRATPVTAPDGIALDGFERIRWHRGALVGAQILPDGLRRIVRLQLDRSQAVSQATAIEPLLGRGGGPTRAAIAGDEMYYLDSGAGDSSSPPGSARPLVVRRIRLP